jgi:hypothetical protein
MSLRVTADSVSQCGHGIFAFAMPPHRVRSFGATAPATGLRSVLLIGGCQYDESHRKLEFDLEQTIALNVGTSSQVIGIDATSGIESLKSSIDEKVHLGHGPGDQQFLKMARTELSANLASAAEMVLSGVRKKSPGDLKKGLSRNFSETPDNFWYVIVQPRIDELSFTVRGPVSHFKALTKLDVKDDRGNTRFKVRSIDDVPDALKLIFHTICKS